MSIDTVIFDLDGVVIDTEEEWNDVRRRLAEAHGGHWNDKTDQAFLMGDNSMQWAARMREVNGVQLSDQEIYDGVVGGLRERYARHLPLIPGAREAIAGLAPHYRLGVASSSPRELIEYALELAELRAYFGAVVSSDEVARGKPAPHVYLEACARLGASPQNAVAVEDSSSGLLAASAAGLAVIAVPNADYPPSAQALALADVILDSIEGLETGLVASLKRRSEEATQERKAMVSKERLDDFIGGQRWAVVGASDDRGKFGNITFRELQSRGKEVYPVNPNATDVEGEVCYPSLTALPARVDRVLIVVPPEQSELVVKDAAEAGLHKVWFQPGAESDEALAYCEAHDMEAIAGHCILKTK